MIISVEKLRQYISSDLPKEVLEAKLSALETLIRQYTGNSFQQREIRSRSAAAEGRIINPPEHLNPGDTVQISDSLLNNGVYTVLAVDAKGLTVNAELLDCRNNLVTKVCYPDDVVMGAVNMLKWELTNRDKVGIQSETISRHSVTYFNMDGDNSAAGYPKSLLGFLKPYMKARF
jgi:hypothetical protein